MAKHSDPTPLAYVRYATVSDVMACGREGIGVFVGSAIVLLGIMAIGEWSASSEPRPSLVPEWLLWPSLVSGALWLYRGEVIKFPNLTFGEWVLLSLASLSFSAVVKFLPWWAGALWIAMMAAVGQVLGRINDAGRERFEASRSQRLPVSTEDREI
jgi:hypothetical protein